MRVLFLTGSSERYMAPPLLSDDQINCGPDWLDRDIGGVVLSLATPLGSYDVARVLERIPPEQYPDVLVCLVDSTFRSEPHNLAAFRGPKVLLVADTHHLQDPLTRMIRYANSEPFDRVVLLYDRHHAEFFQAAGIKSLFWFPGLTFPHDDATVEAVRTQERNRALAFSGSLGICHPRRIRLIGHLLKNKLPLTIEAVGQRETLQLYGRSLIGVNASLNGDLNVRVFEIMAAGAMVFTDTLAVASGLFDVWTEGRELVTYASEGEMIEKANAALRAGSGAEQIAAAGATWFDRHFSLAQRRSAFARIAVDGTPHPLFSLPTAKLVGNGGSSGRLLQAVPAYEFVQELHRNQDRVVVAVDAGTSVEFARACQTLPRVVLSRIPPGGGIASDFLAVSDGVPTANLLLRTRAAWCGDVDPAAQKSALQRFSAAGLQPVHAGGAVCARKVASTHTDPGAVAAALLDQCRYSEALQRANEAMARNRSSVDAHLVLLELAQELGQSEIVRRVSGQLQRIAPFHPRYLQAVSLTEEGIRHRRLARVMRLGAAALQQRQWALALRCGNDALEIEPLSAEPRRLIGEATAGMGRVEEALSYFGSATFLEPENVAYWRHFGLTAFAAERWSLALGALLSAVALDPNAFDVRLALGLAARRAGEEPIASEHLAAAERLRPSVANLIARAASVAPPSAVEPLPRDLLITHMEINRLHGTGALLMRTFPDASQFITIRTHNLSGGKIEFGGEHLRIPPMGLNRSLRAVVLRAMLRHYHVRRIVVAPFYVADFENAVVAQRLTGAPVCTYVLDDQTIYSSNVPREVAAELFACSDLRLAISPEMAELYQRSFGCAFGLLPPFLTQRPTAIDPRWVPAPGQLRAAMVGNVWSREILQKIRSLVRDAGMALDWFGNVDSAMLPKDPTILPAEGITVHGYVPDLAQRLSGYPFVVVPTASSADGVPSGWLMLSIPSRIIDILSQCHLPLLVLGAKESAAARFVERFQVGVCSSYDSAEARSRIADLTEPEAWKRRVAAARALVPRFVLGAPAAWIWESLARKTPAPAPFDECFAADRTGPDQDGGTSPTECLTTSRQ